MHVGTTNGIDCVCVGGGGGGGGGAEGKRTLDLAQYMEVKWRAFVNTVKELRIA